MSKESDKKLIVKPEITIETRKDLHEYLTSKDRNHLHVMMFTAGWCGPCTRIKKEIEGDNGLAEKYKDQVTFYYLDIDNEKYQGVTEVFGITSIPVFYILNQTGTNIDESKAIKGVNKNELEAMINNISNK